MTEMRNYRVIDTSQYPHTVSKNTKRQATLNIYYPVPSFSTETIYVNKMFVVESVPVEIKNSAGKVVAIAHTFDFSDPKYAIVPNGYAHLDIVTDSAASVIKYSTYTNQAVLVPSQPYLNTAVKTGNHITSVNGAAVCARPAADI